MSKENKEGKVLSFKEARKKKALEKLDKAIEGLKKWQEDPGIEEAFEEIERKNKENEERMKRDRERKNRAVKREYKLHKEKGDKV